MSQELREVLGGNGVGGQGMRNKGANIPLAYTKHRVESCKSA